MSRVSNLTGLSSLTVETLLDHYARRKLSPVDVLKSALARIDAVDSQVHAMVALDRDRALTDARAAEQAWLAGSPGPLCGIPVAVKDTIEVEGLPTTYGSRAFRDHRAPDSEVARRLRASGAIIIGKTNTSEFALSTFCVNRLFPPTLNPADLARTAGGSSGGSAAAVAAGMVPLAIGTDSAGSVRIPAAFCGVFGIKPTFGTIPFWQQWRASPTRSHVGIFSHTARDSQLALAALSAGTLTAPAPTGPRSPKEVATALQGLSIAFLGDDPNLEGTLARAMSLLTGTGVKMIEAAPMPAFDVPGKLRDGESAFAGDHYCAVERLCPGFWEQHAQDLSNYAYPHYDAGRTGKAWQYREVLDQAEIYRRQVQDWFGQYDIVLTSACPEAPLQPADPDECGLGPRYPNISVWNFAHNPAAAIPIGTGSNGAPVALQIVGRYREDAQVLKVSACLEYLLAASRHTQHPPQGKLT